MLIGRRLAIRSTSGIGVGGFYPGHHAREALSLASASATSAPGSYSGIQRCQFEWDFYQYVYGYWFAFASGREEFPLA